MSNKLWSDNDFDARFRSHEKLVKRSFGVIFAIWIAWAIFCLAALCGIIYVAWHFISKYW